MKRELDAGTVRSVVKTQRAWMRRNAHYWPNDEWRFMESFLDRLTKRAERIERKRARKAAK